jgi:hypothetical protein
MREKASAGESNEPAEAVLESNVVICLDLLSSPTRVLSRWPPATPELGTFLSHRGSPINLRQVILDQKVR